MINPSSIFDTQALDFSPAIITPEQEILNLQPMFVLADHSAAMRLKESEAKCLDYHQEVLALLEKNLELQLIVQKNASVEVNGSSDELNSLRQRLQEIEDRNIQLNMQVIMLSISTSTTALNEPEVMVKEKDRLAWIAKINTMLAQITALHGKCNDNPLYASLCNATKDQLSQFKSQLPSITDLAVFNRLISFLEHALVTTEAALFLLNDNLDHQFDIQNTSVTLEDKRDLESKIANLMTSHSKLLQDHSSKQKSLQSIIDSSKELLNERNSNSESITLNNASLKQKYLTLLDQRNGLQRQLSDKELELETIQSDNEALKSTVVKQKEIIASMKTSGNANSESRKDDASRIQSLEAQLIRNATDEKRQASLILDLKQDIEKLDESLASIKQQNKALERRLEESAAHSRNLSASSVTAKAKDTLGKTDDAGLIKQLRSTIQDQEIQITFLKQQRTTVSAQPLVQPQSWEQDFARIQKAYNSQQHEYKQIENVIDAYERQFRDIQVIIQTLTEIGQLPPLDESIISQVSLTEHPLPFSVFFNQLEILYVHLRQERETLSCSVDAMSASALTRNDQIETLNQHLNRKTHMINESMNDIQNLTARLKAADQFRAEAESRAEESRLKMIRVVGKCKLVLDISPSKQRICK